ncbi:MAG: glutamate 5-kinase [Gammaproteobacteria bacterium]|nr:glutamate 5-kinase [Gammaproteobacteria bacterium]
MVTRTRRRAGRSRLREATRVVVKIGSSLLVEKSTGRLHRKWLQSLAREIARLRGRGQQVVLVSSGAIALGRRYLGLRPDQRKLEEQQAAAAAGQIILAHAYQELLNRHEIKVAQVLLTLEDTESRQRYLNARNTLQTLLELGAVPVINENDTVATAEIRYGDNDRLGARVAEMVSADCLVLLSDVDGLYSADPTRDPGAQLIAEVHEITPEIEALAGASATEFGSGGMVTKLVAARIALSAGCATVIASGKRLRPLAAIEAGKPSTWFVSAGTPLAARKQWIAGTLKPRGEITIDEGAERALAAGRSLLPVGVVAVAGRFGRGDAVTIRNRDGRDLARGLVAYDSDEARRIQGRRSDEVEALLGYRGRDELVHRDNLALINGGQP